MKKRGMLELIFDFVMAFLTGGLWLIWLLIRYLRQSQEVNMAEHDKYDKDILKALQKIGKHLESIDKKLTTGAVIPIVEEKKEIDEQFGKEIICPN